MKKATLLSLLLLTGAFFVPAAMETQTASAQGKVYVDGTETEYVVALSEYSIDGYDESIVVYAPDGEIVQTTDGKFVCTDLGAYTIEKEGNTLKTINVIYKAFDTVFAYETAMATEVKASESVVFPFAVIYSEQESYSSYDITIAKDGVVLEELTAVSQAMEYSFSVSGEYVVTYSVVDSYGLTAKDENVITVLKNKDIRGINIAETCCVLNDINFASVEGIYEGKIYPVQVQIFNAQNEEQPVNNAKFTPVKTGAYKAVFTCEFPDGELVKELNFNVVLAEGSLFSNGTNITGITLNDETAKKGLEISADGTGASIYYNQLIDLSEFSSDDRLISFYVPKNDNSDVQDIRITLIDAMDVNNQVSIYWRRSKSAGWEHLTYCLVEFNGYALAIDNEKGTNEPREVYGAILTCSFLRESYSFNVTYDREENAFYTWRTASQKIILLDLDDEDTLKKYKTWGGFSSEYVYMKIDFINNVKSTIQIESINGINLKTSGIEIKDDEYLRFSYRDEMLVSQQKEMLTGYVNKKYALPVPMTENVLFGDIDVDLQLMVDTGNGFEESADTVTDYVFTPTVGGTYKAVYGYYDLYGAYQTKAFTFNVNANTAPSINIYGANITADIMSYAAAPEITVMGGTGKVNKTVSYSYNGEAVEPNEDGLFFLNKKGNIEITVNAEDEIGVTAMMVFYIMVNNDVRLIDVSEVPLSYISGREYTLSDFTAIDYLCEEGASGYYLPKSVYVNGELLGENRTFTCPTGVSFVTITYYGGEGTAREACKEIVVTVVDNGAENNVSLDNLFALPGDVEGELFEFGYAVKFANDVSLNYANLLTSRELNISFAMLQNATAYTSMTFTLTDYQNEAQTLVIELKNFAEKTMDLYLNGVFQKTISGLTGTYQMGNYKNTKYATYSFYLLDYKMMLADDARNTICAIPTFASGKKYTGFDSGAVKLSVSIGGCTGASTLVLNGLSNQNFTTYAIRNGADKQGPSIAIQEEFERTYAYQQTLIIPNAIAYDVLQGKGYGVELTVTMPSGAKKSFNGETANQLLLNEYGTYTFTYTSYDYFGNSAKYEHVLKLNDAEKPQITVNDVIPTKVAVGETLALGNFTATDNIGVTEQSVYVKTPQTLLVRVDGSYTFKVSGVYTVIYFAKDATGNSHTVVYTVVVE